MEIFAKVYAVEGIGQIVVMQDTNDEGNPAVKYFFKPKDLGVCAVALGFKDDDAGWQRCEKAFENTTEQLAADLVKSQLESIFKS